MKELKDTVDLMLSENPEDRLKAEYWQTMIRVKKLNEVLNTYAMLKAPFTQDVRLLVLQQNSMAGYLAVLRLRAEDAGISLEE